MKRKLILFVTALATSAFYAGADQIKISDTPYNDLAQGGGEFLAQFVGSQSSFMTFCLEKNEHLSYGVPYNAAFNTGAALGGGGAVNGFDPISLGTATLYSQFALGTLTGYDTSTLAARQQSSANLQFAIWWLEGEITLANPGANPFLAQLGDLGAATADANGALGVSVLNLTDSTGANKQDVLSVPDGGLTIMLLGGALTGLAFIRRKS